MVKRGPRGALGPCAQLLHGLFGRIGEGFIIGEGEAEEGRGFARVTRAFEVIGEVPGDHRAALGGVVCGVREVSVQRGAVGEGDVDDVMGALEVVLGFDPVGEQVEGVAVDPRPREGEGEGLVEERRGAGEIALVGGEQALGVEAVDVIWVGRRQIGALVVLTGAAEVARGGVVIAAHERELSEGDVASGSVAVVAVLGLIVDRERSLEGSAGGGGVLGQILGLGEVDEYVGDAGVSSAEEALAALKGVVEVGEGRLELAEIAGGVAEVEQRGREVRVMLAEVLSAVLESVAVVLRGALVVAPRGGEQTLGFEEVAAEDR